MGKYDDIINLSHHTSKNHPQMSLENRAAQFAPFAALVGYAEAINSSKEFKEEKALLADDKKEELEEMLHHLQKGNMVEVSYYLNSKKKYMSYKGVFKRVDQIEHTMIFENRTSIPIKDIVDIQLKSAEN